MDKKNDIKRVRRILNEEWAPIPCAPDDEYNTYAAQIISMLANKNASVGEVVDYLLSIEREMMEFAGDKENCERTARMIILNVV